MSGEVKLVMGELSLTVRVHLVFMSVLPTQRSCHVEWAETDATAARTAKAVFMMSTLGFG
jgi:hypothetical protein